MAVYSKDKYETEIQKLTKRFWTSSWGQLSQFQDFARQISAAPPPPYVLKTTIPAPAEDDALNSLLTAVDGLRQSDEQYTRLSLVDVPAEWVFGDGDAAQTTTGQKLTLLYVHGGGFIYGSPATARRVTQKLAKLTNGRCVAIQYRYGTEQPFPAQLADLFVTYLTLLAPSSANPSHKSVPAERIVFAGESSGLNLLYSLTQVILYLQKAAKSTVQFHGTSVDIKLPAGIAGLSGFFDITCGLPSWSQNSRWDCLPESQPTYWREWKDQDVWPADPPRADIYCEKSAMMHPLVSPVAATSWAGSPPLFLACGEERNTDGNLYIAQQAARQGVTVHLEQYENMTHVWPTALPHLPHSARALLRNGHSFVWLYLRVYLYRLTGNSSRLKR